MFTTRQQRFELRSRLTAQDIKSSLYYRYGVDFGLGLTWFFGRVTLVIAMSSWFWAWLVFFIVPIDMTPTFAIKLRGDEKWLEEMIRGLTFTRFYVSFIHTIFVYSVFSYFVEVIANVPWADLSKPLIDVPRTFSMNYTGRALILMGSYASYKAPGFNLHSYLILAEGLTLCYFEMFNPAFGFVPWTRRDDKLFYATNIPKKKTWYGDVAALLTRPLRRSRDTSTLPEVAPVRRTSVHELINATMQNESRETQATQATQTAEDADIYESPFSPRQPTKTFASIYGMAAVKEKLIKPAREILKPRAPGDEAPRNGILLFGEPGNGKTVFAEALAGELGVPFMEVTYGPISSQWIGNMPRTIANTFKKARKAAPCVLFIDEIDSFIRSRDAANSNGEELKITNTLLTEIVNLHGSNVVLVGATNYLDKLDAAAVREGRMDFKVEITPPDEEARIGIMKALTAKFPKEITVAQDDLLSVAKRWNGFSVARLVAACKAMPDMASEKNICRIEFDHWMAVLRELQGRKGKLPADTMSLANIVLDDKTRGALELIANRLKDVHRVESMGGTLPGGVLFAGPSGTGKTTAVKALAKESGWAFLSVAGPDLTADRGLLQKTFVEAKDIRPTIIFIDEADDVLRNRQYTSTPDMVNKLLTIMDGVDDRVKDIVWIAATNNPDQIDPALLRPGRFTEKIMFSAPSTDMLPRHIAAWLKKREINLDMQHDVFDIAEQLAGRTIADVEGVLQYALNTAINRTKTGKVTLLKEDIASGMGTVLA